ncbi:hypothetical protein DE146DRAFT_634205 [Phaeosphaeria sp. MPI-PUGE-AT-0046c]|nr:hypothetical protein DE146DRAFT_634205 [Phaeosphaeria sp. MPI-PUGE-AT-0046c]
MGYYAGLAAMEVFRKWSSPGSVAPNFVLVWHILALVPAAVHQVSSYCRCQMLQRWLELEEILSEACKELRDYYLWPEDDWSSAPKREPTLETATQPPVAADWHSPFRGKPIQDLVAFMKTMPEECYIDYQTTTIPASWARTLRNVADKRGLCA